MIVGVRTLEMKKNILVSCEVVGYNSTILLDGDLNLGEKFSIKCGTFMVQASNVNLGDKFTINTTTLAGNPPHQSSNTPSETNGVGGGHGG
jgi:hypothetical protein